MSTRVRSDAQAFLHNNLVLSTTAATVVLPAHTSAILIQNIDAAITEYVSLDGDAYVTLVAGASLSVDCDSLKSFLIKADSGTPTANMVFGYEA